MTEQILIECIGCAAQCGKNELVTILTGILNEMQNPVEVKKPRQKPNTSGYVQLDLETGALVAKFDTVAQANEAVGKKKTASCIATACRNYKSGKSNVAYGYKWVYGSDYEA